MIQAIRGTYDVLPSDIGIWHALESRLRETFHRYGFGEIRTPIFEATSCSFAVEEEFKNGIVVLRNMGTKEQRNIREEDFIASI